MLLSPAANRRRRRDAAYVKIARGMHFLCVWQAVGSVAIVAVPPTLQLHNGASSSESAFPRGGTKTARLEIEILCIYKR